MHQLNSSLLNTRPDSADQGVGWFCEMVVKKFDIWAKRGVHVVWTDGTVRAYDEWLHNYAESWLTGTKDFFPSTINIGVLLGELRLRLIGRIEWWKAEARRYLSEQKAHAARSSKHVESDLKPGRWQDVTMVFVSDERVQISCGTQTETRNYQEMGLGSRRNGKPQLAWMALVQFAKSNGVIEIRRDWSKLEKRVQEIRRALRNLFPLQGDPVPFKKKVRNNPDFGYRTAFKIYCGPSFNS